MKIAQVAPLYESVPPKLYGGTERIVHYLTEELVGAGHDVMLFASADSETSAVLEPIVPKALRLDNDVVDPLLPHLLMMDRVRRMAGEFDIIHFHTGCLHFPVFRECSTPHVTTLHGRLDIRELVPLIEAFPDTPLVSISDYQRRPVSLGNWVATVYHGLPEDLYTFRAEPGTYLAFLGRISPEKRVDRAIEIAIRAGMPLKIAAKVDKADREYFDQKIKHLLKHPLVEYIGEVNEREKNELLGNAYALLFPIDWPEPFGLVMIEAMACGTPVIAFRNGSVPEVMRHGATGFIVEDIKQAVAAVERIGEISRITCRKEFESRFSARRMANDYVQIYRQLSEKRKQRVSPTLKVLGMETVERLPMVGKLI
ncbi:glycosyltransferase family 4 protein [Methylocaldum szegediense]|uniref:Glycosyltransferase involved in cell wall biosynthesis n=1 Tax=Methylocaldum szegediense TaxID=73780 RepID=A0ABM9I374_9GAMM|nr:glycosyltransferase family 4 protein [Methylocaldum szegediense]CAI8861186.1 Glycosyltransferase involved in cell wall biosynthesis [Methylocaldum szegediense]